MNRITFVCWIVSVFTLVSSFIPRKTRDENPWKPVPFTLVSTQYRTYTITAFANVFTNQKHSIVRVAPELKGLTGVQLEFSPVNHQHPSVTLAFARTCTVLIGVPHDSTQTGGLPRSLIRTGKGNIRQKPVLTNAVTITALPLVDVYAVDFPKGTHTIEYEQAIAPLVILGVTKLPSTLVTRDVALPDGRLWEPFAIDGFHAEKPVFEIIGGPDTPVVDEGMPGTEGIQGGFEGGTCVKIGNTYHMFPTERAGETGVAAYFDRVKTRIGYWTSQDAIHWTRKSTIYQASGTYAVTDDDNPINDRRGAIWSFNPVFNAQKNRWYGYYLTYTVSKTIAPNHSFGRIWQATSQTPGMQGIGGPYNEGQLIMEPGLDTQLWEGRQGVASLFPYPVKDHWLGFYSGAYPYEKKEDYPDKTGKGWYVGLAKSHSMEGPWTRLDTTINPIRSIHPWFVENPIVYHWPDRGYIAVFDGGPEGFGHHLPNMVAYTLSKDGYQWSEARYLPFATKVSQWWDIMRTPMGLIDEGNDVFTIVYAAISNTKRFHPLGMIRVKLNREALDAQLKKLP